VQPGMRLRCFGDALIDLGAKGLLWHA
jgi:hypothetical protein